MDLLRTLLLHTVTVHTAVALRAVDECCVLRLRLARALLGALVHADRVGALLVAALDDFAARRRPDLVGIGPHHLLRLLHAARAENGE